MSDERADWERRLESLDEQLAAFGVPTASKAAAERSDGAGHDGPQAAPDVADAGIAPEQVEQVEQQRDAGALATRRAEPAEAGRGGDDPTGDDRVGDDGVGGDDDDAEDDEAATGASRRRVLFDWLVVVGIALLVAFMVRTFVLAHFVVDGVSMSSTLHDGDRVFVNKLSYRLHEPNRGDVVVLHQLEGTTSRDLIKRVVALPGETVEMRNCVVTIDGRVLLEPYLDPEATTPGSCGGDQAPLEIPDDHVFVMGDNRGQSQDSRALGPIDEDNLVGRAFVVFWPRGSWQWL